MIKNIMISLLLCCFIVGCAILPETSNIFEVTNTEQNPALGTVEASVVPTMTIEPTKTSMPKEIQDIEELTRWIDNYVKANNGKVQINGVEMDSSQLEVEVRKNINSYLVTKYINNSGTQFLVINSTPIAIKADGEKWKEATLKMLGDIVGVKIGTLLGDPNISKIFIDTYWRNEYHIGVSCFDNSNITRNGETDWDWSNTQFQMAKTNDLETRLQAVLFGLYRPSWANEDVTQEDLDMMTRLIVKYAKEKGVTEIVVTNESTPYIDQYRNDIYWDKFGIDYILNAFRLTKEIYPEAKLIFNDTGNHTYWSTSTKTTREIANKLLEEGLIDYVGVEMHVDDFFMPNKDEIIEVFQSYPVPVVITEFDALLENIPANQKSEEMARITKIVFDGCLESGVCLSITTWGENDATTWEGRSVLHDQWNQRKLAYYVAMQSMYEHIPQVE